MTFYQLMYNKIYCASIIIGKLVLATEPENFRMLKGMNAADGSVLARVEAL